MTLKEFFAENPKVALGFSGGVDSSFLLYAAKKYGADVKAYFIKSVFQPAFEFEDAMKVAKQIGVEVTVVKADILSNEEVAKNPKNRCYYCKVQLFSTLKALAVKEGFSVIIDGTNASDDVEDRPGMKALNELLVKSPLRECGLSKKTIRELSKEAGLFTWDKPAYACLATRVPIGQKITPELLLKVEKAEEVLFAKGFTDFRVRVFEDAARLQIKKDQLKKLIENREDICNELTPFFENVMLDLKECR